MKELLQRRDINRIWCPGCGLYVIEKMIADAVTEYGWSKENTVVISGIGCSARIAEYFNLDSMHTTHGRAISVAEGIKTSNPKINVLVISGDGDLLSIGGNHLMHAARRNLNIKVFCNRNEIYGMTGGQLAPTTLQGEETKTSPTGSTVPPINIKPVITSNQKHFFARTSTIDIPHFKESIKQSLDWDGFSFVEIISPCVTDIERKIHTENMGEINKTFRTKLEHNKTLYEVSDLYTLQIDKK